MFKNLYKNIYSIPALVLHELSHIIISILLGGKLKGVEIKSSCSVELKISNLKSLTQVRLVAMSPLLVPIAFIALSFVDTNFIAGLVYSVSVFKTTLPSPTDFSTSKFKCPKFLKKN